MKDVIIKADELGICKEWSEKMKNNASLGHFCKLYFLGDDWAMENDFPTLELLRKYKGTEAFGLYTDNKSSFENVQNLAFFGNSEVDLEYNGFEVGYLNIRHDSKVKIKVKDNAILMINLLDNAEVEIDNLGMGKVSVYQYSENAKVKYQGNVEVKPAKFG